MNEIKRWMKVEIEKGTGAQIAAGLATLFEGMERFLDERPEALLADDNKMRDWVITNYNAISGAVSVAAVLSDILYKYLEEQEL